MLYLIILWKSCVFLNRPSQIDAVSGIITDVGIVIVISGFIVTHMHTYIFHVTNVHRTFAMLIGL